MIKFCILFLLLKLKRLRFVASAQANGPEASGAVARPAPPEAAAGGARAFVARVCVCPVVRSIYTQLQCPFLFLHSRIFDRSSTFERGLNSRGSAWMDLSLCLAMRFTFNSKQKHDLI